MFRAKIDLNNSQFLMPITPKKLAFTRNYRHNYSLAGGNKDTSQHSILVKAFSRQSSWGK